MKFMVKLFIGLALFCFPITSSVYAITVSGNAPTITAVSVGGIDYTGDFSSINSEINAAYQNAIDEANIELQKYGNQPELAKGFANANIYAAQAATHQGYQDYDLFAVTTGVMIGAQLPSSDPDYYNDLEEKIKEDGDIYAGVGAGLAIINAGINVGFIYPGLYLSLKFGTLSLDGDDFNDDLEGFHSKSTLFGIGANYSYIRNKSFLFGLVKWRGVSFGTGFLYNKNEIDFKVDLEPIDDYSYTIDLSTIFGALPTDYTGNAVIDPSINLGIKAETYTIPFDVTTSVRLLYLFNFNLGAGVDLNWGNSDIIVKADGSGDITEDPSYPSVVLETTPGTVNIDGSTKGEKPSFIHARITTGIGLNILPVKIDVPVILYPFDSAFAVGLTAGIVW